MLLNGRIWGILIVVTKEEEVFVLDIVVGLEVLIRFAVDIIVVDVGWSSRNLCLNSGRLWLNDSSAGILWG